MADQFTLGFVEEHEAIYPKIEDEVLFQETRCCWCAATVRVQEAHFGSHTRLAENRTWNLQAHLSLLACLSTGMYAGSIASGL
ncbi:hypothetical protein WJX74_009344 [Apatococcus lobatus]|uniref:Uncharacterized protein n=1 Tax=Apatococcus lobatus TaxID=904363 RepID=A0AAW1QY26_9CHLO